MRINNNVAAFNAYRNLSQTQNQVGKSLEKLSSGFRINRAADDASGLSISENLRAKVGGLKVASRNAQDAISVVQTAEGALTEVHSILQRMRDLSVQAANTGGNDETARQAAQDEVSELLSELDRIANTTKFGSKVLIDGSAPLFTFQVGSDAGQIVTVAFSGVNTANGELGVAGMNITTSAGASTAIVSLDLAISYVSESRSRLGAFQNRMESTVRNLGVATENLSAAESRIRDTDMAMETVTFTRNQILQQAGVAMLAQANTAPQSVLQLLG